jgi:hypothetical protein
MGSFETCSSKVSENSLPDPSHAGSNTGLGRNAMLSMPQDLTGDGLEVTRHTSTLEENRSIQQDRPPCSWFWLYPKHIVPSGQKRYGV